MKPAGLDSDDERTMSVPSLTWNKDPDDEFIYLPSSESDSSCATIPTEDTAISPAGQRLAKKPVVSLVYLEHMAFFPYMKNGTISMKDIEKSSYKTLDISKFRKPDISTAVELKAIPGTQIYLVPDSEDNSKSLNRTALKRTPLKRPHLKRTLSKREPLKKTPGYPDKLIKESRLKCKPVTVVVKKMPMSVLLRYLPGRAAIYTRDVKRGDERSGQRSGQRGGERSGQRCGERVRLPQRRGPRRRLTARVAPYITLDSHDDNHSSHEFPTSDETQMTQESHVIYEAHTPSATPQATLVPVEDGPQSVVRVGCLDAADDQDADALAALRTQDNVAAPQEVQRTSHIKPQYSESYEKFLEDNFGEKNSNIATPLSVGEGQEEEEIATPQEAQRTSYIKPQYSESYEKFLEDYFVKKYIMETTSKHSNRARSFPYGFPDAAAAGAPAGTDTLLGYQTLKKYYAQQRFANATSLLERALGKRDDSASKVVQSGGEALPTPVVHENPVGGQPATDADSGISVSGYKMTVTPLTRSAEPSPWDAQQALQSVHIDGQQIRTVNVGDATNTNATPNVQTVQLPGGLSASMYLFTPVTVFGMNGSVVLSPNPVNSVPVGNAPNVVMVPNLSVAYPGAAPSTLPLITEVRSLATPPGTATVPIGNTTVAARNIIVPAGNITVPAANTTKLTGNAPVPAGETNDLARITNELVSILSMRASNTAMLARSRAALAANASEPPRNTTVLAGNTTVPAGNTTVPTTNTTVPARTTTSPAHASAVPAENLSVGNIKWNMTHNITPANITTEKSPEGNNAQNNELPKKEEQSRAYPEQALTRPWIAAGVPQLQAPADWPPLAARRARRAAALLRDLRRGGRRALALLRLQPRRPLWALAAEWMMCTGQPVPEKPEESEEAEYIALTAGRRHCRVLWAGDDENDDEDDGEDGDSLPCKYAPIDSMPGLAVKVLPDGLDELYEEPPEFLCSSDSDDDAWAYDVNVSCQVSSDSPKSATQIYTTSCSEVQSDSDVICTSDRQSDSVVQRDGAGTESKQCRIKVKSFAKMPGTPRRKPRGRPPADPALDVIVSEGKLYKRMNNHNAIYARVLSAVGQLDRAAAEPLYAWSPRMRALRHIRKSDEDT